MIRWILNKFYPRKYHFSYEYLSLPLSVRLTQMSIDKLSQRG